MVLAESEPPHRQIAINVSACESQAAICGLFHHLGEGEPRLVVVAAAVTPPMSKSLRRWSEVISGWEYSKTSQGRSSKCQNKEEGREKKTQIITSAHGSYWRSAAPLSQLMAKASGSRSPVRGPLSLTLGILGFYFTALRGTEEDLAWDMLVAKQGKKGKNKQTTTEKA